MPKGTSPSLVPGGNVEVEQAPFPAPPVEDAPPQEAAAPASRPQEKIVYICPHTSHLKIYMDRGIPGRAGTDLNPYGSDPTPPWIIEFVDHKFPGPGRALRQRDINAIEGIYEPGHEPDPNSGADKLAELYRAGAIYRQGDAIKAAAIKGIQAAALALRAAGASEEYIAEFVQKGRTGLKLDFKGGEPPIISGTRLAGPQARPAPILTGNLGAWEGLTPNINK